MGTYAGQSDDTLKFWIDLKQFEVYYLPMYIFALDEARERCKTSSNTDMVIQYYPLLQHVMEKLIAVSY